MTDSHDTPRRVEAQIEVPGTAEEVWEAIATGTGIAAWFVPAEVEPREGGRIALDFGAGLEDAGTIAAWEPPRRYVGEEDFDTRLLATEYLVEARSGGTCVVRIVSSLFGGGDDWHQELGSMQEGWSIFLRVLRRYLADFAGQPSATMMVQHAVAAPAGAAWGALAAELGLDGVAAGERVRIAVPAAAPIAGVVAWVADGAYHDGLMLHIDEPAPGTAIVFVNVWRDAVIANIHAHFYGDAASAVASREEAAWRAWTPRMSTAATTT